MQVTLPETSLVIAGAWNPAILTPAWILQHAMQNTDAQAHMVQAVFPAMLNGAFDFPRFMLPGFAYTARNDAVVFLPESMAENVLSNMEDVVARLLAQLNHTPIGGVGHNFEFRHSPTRDEWLEPFNRSQVELIDAAGGWNVSRTTLATSFVIDQVTINIQRYTEGDAMVVKFNFHHSVNSAAEARLVTVGQGFPRFWQNFETAKSIVQKLYGNLDD